MVLRLVISNPLLRGLALPAPYSFAPRHPAHTSQSAKPEAIEADAAIVTTIRSMNHGS